MSSHRCRSRSSDNVANALLIGIGGGSVRRPSHTTVRTDPYTAVRLVMLTLRRVLGFSLHPGRLGPFCLAPGSFPPPGEREGRLFLAFLPLFTHEIRALLTTPIVQAFAPLPGLSGLRGARPARPTLVPHIRFLFQAAGHAQHTVPCPRSCGHPGMELFSMSTATSPAPPGTHR